MLSKEILNKCDRDNFIKMLIMWKNTLWIYNVGYVMDCTFFGIYLGTRTLLWTIFKSYRPLMLWLSRIILDGGVPFAYPTLYIRDVAWKYSLFRTRRPQWWTIFSYDSHFDEFVPVTIVSYFSRCFNDVCVYHFHEEKTKKNSIPPFCFGLFFGGPNVIVCSCPLIFSGSTSNTKNSSNPKKVGYILQFW